MSILNSYSKINVVSLSTDNASATELLKKCFLGFECSSDFTNGPYSMDGVSLELYTKYPGDDILKNYPEFIDFVLVSVPKEHQQEEELISYAQTKVEARGVYLLNEEERTLPSRVQSSNVEKITLEIKKFHSELLQLLESKKDENENSLFIQRKRLGSGESVNEDFEFADMNFSLLPNLKSMMKSFEKIDLNKLYSENVMKLNFSPTNDESNGVGIKLNIYVGDSFDENNKNLPLTVRDNPFTITIELQAKSEKHVDDVLSLLKNAKEMIQNMGLLKNDKKLNFDLSFSKDGTSVFIDMVIDNLGEGIVHKVRSLNFSKFNYSFSDFINAQTNLNLSELWKNPDLDNIINKLATFTIQGEGKFINFRTIFKFLREALLYVKNDKEKQDYDAAINFFLIISCFENLCLELKYDSKDLKSNIMEIFDAYLKDFEGEGSSQAFIEMGNESVKNFLHGGLQLIESIAPMFTALGNLSAINFDKISFEYLAPFARIELKLDILLPGLNEFVSEKIISQ